MLGRHRRLTSNLEQGAFGVRRSARDLVGKPVGICLNFITEQARKQLRHYAKSPNAGWESYLSLIDAGYGRTVIPRGMPPKVLKQIASIRRPAVRTIKAH